LLHSCQGLPNGRAHPWRHLGARGGQPFVLAGELLPEGRGQRAHIGPSRNPSGHKGQDSLQLVPVFGDQGLCPASFTPSGQGYGLVKATPGEGEA
jgi:hypothetical protein